MPKDISASRNATLPLLPLRDIVVFPQTVPTIFVGRQVSINALNAVNSEKQLILLAIQRDPEANTLSPQALYEQATIGKIIQRIQLPDGYIKILVEGITRVTLKKLTEVDGYWTGTYKIEKTQSTASKKLTKLVDDFIEILNTAIESSNKLPNEAFSTVSPKNPIKNVEIVAANLPLSIHDKYLIFSEANLIKRYELLIQHLLNIISSSNLDKKINARVKNKIDKTHREYFLNEKMRAIKHELGDEEGEEDDFEQLKKRIKAAMLPEHALKKAKSELKKLSNTPHQSPEYSVVRNYLDTLLDLPWSQSSELNPNIMQASKVLNNDHYGLEEVKKLILEHLAVQKRSQKPSATILCLVGPPGVGKTSLAASIAKATGRKYVRMALGGVRDEAEIRGHRRTYIGSMCGKILQKLTQAQANNPLFLLDEIDKMSMDFRGDPASALLEVLDPEQNKHFSDHYLDIDFDLSNVLFLATSNSYHIPTALLDRMETIELSGYTDSEKLHIAKDYLLPKQRKKNVIQPRELKLNQGSIPYIIKNYTREAGVRSLERKIAQVCRKTVHLAFTQPKSLPVSLNQATIHELLGTPPFKYDEKKSKSSVGQVTGLAWSQVGGDILTIECLNYPGKGKLTSTGKLGEVMQESVQAALSFVRSRHYLLGICANSFSEFDTHIHVPEGATPKDGPSAGVALAVAIASSFSHNPVKANVAMTGEITLRGDVLAIGGLKQKLLAAKRSNIKTVLIPHDNERHLPDIPDDIKQGLEIISIKNVEEAFDAVLEKPLKKEVNLVRKRPIVSAQIN